MKINTLLHKSFNNIPRWEGMRRTILIQTGYKTFCLVGVWGDEESMVKNRQNRVSFLDTLRPMLEEISSEFGVTDPVSGSIVSEV